jgi:hypothetical protein
MSMDKGKPPLVKKCARVKKQNVGIFSALKPKKVLTSNMLCVKLTNVAISGAGP